jgi:hypothetical protein
VNLYDNGSRYTREKRDDDDRDRDSEIVGFIRRWTSIDSLVLTNHGTGLRATHRNLLYRTVVLKKSNQINHLHPPPLYRLDFDGRLTFRACFTTLQNVGRCY